jgi:ATP-dependent Clp protease protease subunit
MIKNRLLALLAGNAKKGEFRAEGNVIYVYDVIVAADADAAWFGGVSAESFVKTLRGMTGDVELRINSPGGDVFGAKAMAQAVREYAGKVTAHVDGYAASAASYLATSAESTIMAPGSMMMIHKAWTIALGNADEFKATADLLDKIDGTIAADYAASAERRGKDAQDFEALMAAETWFTPAEAIEAGLADEEAGEKVQAKVQWDLSAYDHAPAPKAEEPAPVLEPEAVEPPAAVEEPANRTGDRAAAPGPEVRHAAQTSCLSARARLQTTEPPLGGFFYTQGD